MRSLNKKPQGRSLNHKPLPALQFDAQGLSLARAALAKGGARNGSPIGVRSLKLVKNEMEETSTSEALSVLDVIRALSHMNVRSAARAVLLKDITFGSGEFAPEQTIPKGTRVFVAKLSGGGYETNMYGETTLVTENRLTMTVDCKNWIEVLPSEYTTEC